VSQKHSSTKKKDSHRTREEIMTWTAFFQAMRKGAVDRAAAITRRGGNTTQQTSGGSKSEAAQMTTPMAPIRTTPYSAWWHPHKTVLQCVMGWIFSYILPLYKIANYPASKDSAEAMERIEGFRGTLNKLEHMGKAVTTNFQKWSSLAGGSPIAEVDYKVPRRPNLLKAWGRTTAAFDNETSSSDITVRMFFPRSLLSAGGDDVDGVPTTDNSEANESKLNDYGCQVVKLTDLSRLPAHVPLVVYFHGGGGTMGVGLDSDATTLAVKLVEEQTEPIILASVEYSLAPDHPFPTTHVEAIDVLSHFIETTKTSTGKRAIHVAGSSFGGYLAIVATMECLRHYPASDGQQRVKSLLSCCPMLDPACDSQSYFECSQDPTRFIDFARWSWQAILELPSSKDTIAGSQKPSTTTTHEDALAKNSNKTAWNQCKWKGSSLEGLIKPIVNVPKGLDAHTAPTIIITTNRADALYTEGVEYANKLRENTAKITHLDHSGCHWVGTTMDPKAMAELITVWKKAIFE
jgi:acetyl esterase/lipase